MIFGPLFMILFLAVLIAVVVLLVRWLGGPLQGTMPSHHTPPRRTPLDILKERFARRDRQERIRGAAPRSRRIGCLDWRLVGAEVAFWPKGGRITRRRDVHADPANPE